MAEMRHSFVSIAGCLRQQKNGVTRLLAVAVMLLSVCAPVSLMAFESGHSKFPVQVNGLEIPYRVFAVYVLPGETLEVSAKEPRGGRDVAITAAAGGRPQPSVAGWSWQAPQLPGVSTLEIASGDERIELNVVVLMPSTTVVDQRINGYRLGAYPEKPLNGNALYLPPEGFIELTPDILDLKLSPHFKLSQFPSKQSGEFPKYLVLREQLLMKLELLLEQVNRDGIAADTFTIMSGYRTPYYNAAIKNVPYSRHVFGGAADIYIDFSPRDDVMDDLNHDGRSDYRDAQALYQIADRLFSDPKYAMLRGGLGIYESNAVHGPFLHMDARQQDARWGALP